MGLELSASAAAHARDLLALDVREQTLAELAADESTGTFEVIVLADVLEHLDDPLARARRLPPAARARAACCA